MVTKLNSRVSTELIGLKIQWLAGVKVFNFLSQNIFFAWWDDDPFSGYTGFISRLLVMSPVLHVGDRMSVWVGHCHFEPPSFRLSFTLLHLKLHFRPRPSPPPPTTQHNWREERWTGLRTTTELHTCRAHPHSSFIFCTCFCFVLLLLDSCFVFVFANKARM